MYFHCLSLPSCGIMLQQINMLHWQINTVPKSDQHIVGTQLMPVPQVTFSREHIHVNKGMWYYIQYHSKNLITVLRARISNLCPSFLEDRGEQDRNLRSKGTEIFSKDPSTVLINTGIQQFILLTREDLWPQRRMKTLVQESGSHQLFTIYSTFTICSFISVGAEGIRVNDSWLSHLRANSLSGKKSYQCH